MYNMSKISPNVFWGILNDTKPITKFLYGVSQSMEYFNSVEKLDNYY